MDRARKRKRAATKLPREATPIAKEELEAEEMGGFEYYLEHPVLFPSAKETLLAQNRA